MPHLRLIPIVAAVLLAAAVFIPASAPAQETPKAPYLLGGDVSMAPKIEAAGVVFKDHGQPKDIFAIFKDHGATAIRLRLFVNPEGRGGVVNDIPYTIALAKRVKAAGLLFSLDFHYSDTWADPGHQVTPAAWQSLAFPQLVQQLRTYTAQTLKQFQDAGVTPDVVQIGNEITIGLLWPQGRIGSDKTRQATDFDRVADLLKAAGQGVHDALGDPCATRIMIHIDGGETKNRAKWFFDAMTQRNVPFDMIGLSFYPLNHGGTIAGIAQTLGYAARAYGKPIAVVETAYPYEESPWMKHDPANAPYPFTPQGQKEFLTDLIKAVDATPNGLGAGVLWWYPESVETGVRGAGGWQGGSCAMFDADGNALPAFDAFAAH